MKTCDYSLLREACLIENGKYIIETVEDKETRR